MRAAVILIFFLGQLAPHATNTSCSITVVDPVGAPVAKALVLIHDNRDGSQHSVQPVFTDGNGTASESVNNGLYDVCVMAPTFAPTCKQVRVQDHEIHLRFALSFSRFIKMVS